MYTVKGKPLPYFGKKVTALITTLVIGFNGIGAGIPFFFAQKALAAPANVSNETELITALADNTVELITFSQNISTSSQLNITRSVTIDGDGFSFLPSFSWTSNSNNSAIGIIGTTNVTISDLTVNGISATSLHGINIYESTGVLLQNVTAQNNGRSGVVVNSSSVTVQNITTNNNSWHGINVDQKTSSPASLTVNGVSSHNEILPIFVDDDTKDVTITDTENQYVATEGPLYPNDIVYTLAPSLPPCSLDDTTFDTFALGSVNGQNGWGSTGPYDQEIVNNNYGYSEFGCKTLRISNATTSGSFGDQTFSYSVINEAGESTAGNDGMSGGTRQNYFEAEWDFASAAPSSEQTGLSITASADRGDGARMSWIQMTDTATGLGVNFYDFSGGDFVLTNIASNLDRTQTHSIKTTMHLLEGPANDVVKVYVDGILVHTGTSWEDYFRDVEGNPTRTVDSLLFRASGVAVPANYDKGFLIDNVAISTSTIPAVDTPTNLRLNNVNGEFACGLVTSINYITPTWNSVAGAVSYNYRVVLPGGGVFGPINVGNVTSVSGAFGGVGLSTFSVQAVDAGGLTSDWAVPCAVTYDPAVPSAPTNPRWENSAGDTLGAYTDVNLVTPIWDAPATGPVDHYEYSFQSPIAGWSAPEPFYTNSIPNQSFYGAGDTGTEGVWQFRVRTVSASGLTSDWAVAPTLTYDKTLPALPTHEFPANNSFINYNNFWFEWTDATDAVSYETQYSQDPAVDANGAFQNVQWTGDYQMIQPTSSSAHSVGANGTWYWQVRAVDIAGNKSAWTSPWKVTIDMSAPTLPSSSMTQDSDNASVPNGGQTNSQYFTFTLASSPDTVRYQLKYWNDIPASPFKLLTPWNPSDLSGYSPVLGTYKDNFTQGDGVHYFAFSACDSAGNCSAYSSPFVVTYDSTAPAVSIDSFSASGNVITPSVTATDANSPLTYSWSTDPDVTISDTTAQEPDFTANADGTYSFTLTATDPAGNSSTATFGFTYTAPVVEEEEEETPAPAVTPPAVLGASTTATPTAFTNVTTRNSSNQTNPVPEETAPEEESAPDVQGALTEKVATTAGDTAEKVTNVASTKNFLWLGWWWLPLLLVSGILFWLLFGKDNKEDEQA